MKIKFKILFPPMHGHAQRIVDDCINPLIIQSSTFIKGKQFYDMLRSYKKLVLDYHAQYLGWLSFPTLSQHTTIKL